VREIAVGIHVDDIRNAVGSQTNVDAPVVAQFQGGEGAAGSRRHVVEH